MMRRFSKPDYEEDPESFPADTYSCTHWPGIAMRVLGWDIIEDTYDHVERTGRVTVRMVGDDKHWYVDRDTLAPIPEEEYCHDCGQIGCTSNTEG
jgi:hypothetical protein